MGEKLTYFQVWEQQRKIGPLPIILRASVQGFMILMFLNVCYHFYNKNFSDFQVGVPIFLIPILLGISYWYVNELLYKKFIK